MKPSQAVPDVLMPVWRLVSRNAPIIAGVSCTGPPVATPTGDRLQSVLYRQTSCPKRNAGKSSRWPVVLNSKVQRLAKLSLLWQTRGYTLPLNPHSTGSSGNMTCGTTGVGPQRESHDRSPPIVPQAQTRSGCGTSPT